MGPELFQRVRRLHAGFADCLKKFGKAADGGNGHANEGRVLLACVGYKLPARRPPAAKLGGQCRYVFWLGKLDLKRWWGMVTLVDPPQGDDLPMLASLAVDDNGALVHRSSWQVAELMTQQHEVGTWRL